MQKNLITAFVIFTITALVLTSVLLSYELIVNRKDNKTFFKVFFVVFSPTPLVIYSLFILKARGDLKEKESRKTTGWALILFMMCLLFSIGVINSYEMYFNIPFEQTIFPLFFNSIILSIYIVNFLIIDSTLLAGVLSGIVFGMTIHIVFLN